MLPRYRKLVGTIVLFVFLTVYALAAMFVAIILEVNGQKWAELPYYFIAGLLWVLPAAYIISWMSKDPADVAKT